MNRLWTIGLTLILVACGGGGGGGDVEPPITQKPTQIRQCAVYRKTDGLFGFSFWGSCESHTWEPRPGEPIFSSREACEARIKVLKKSDSYVYDNSDEDKARHWARKLFCLDPDTTAPSVISRSPADGSVDFPIGGTSVRVGFSENMEAATFNTTTFTLEDAAGALVAGTVEYYEKSRNAYFSADAPLSSSTTYTARITTGVTDNSGNALRSGQSWSFTTKEPEPDVNADVTGPSKVAASPMSGNVCVSPGRPVSVRFDETLDPGTMTAATFTLEDSNGTPINGEVALNDLIATFSPAAPLELGTTYTARLLPGIADSSGNGMAAESWSFATPQQSEGSWSSIATALNLESRSGYSTVWTGTEIIVWGGRGQEYYSDGARYDPVLDQWSEISQVGAPTPRGGHTAIWSGTEMIVWGGDGAERYTDGAKYDPATDSWAPMNSDGAPRPRSAFSAVWTGTEMIIWGGQFQPAGYEGDGSRYNPETDTWTRMSGINAPRPRANHFGMFDGERMIIFGGNTQNEFGWFVAAEDGAIYDPLADVWTPLPAQNSPESSMVNQKANHAVEAGSNLIVWSIYSEYVVDPVAGNGNWETLSETRRYDSVLEQWEFVVDACESTATPNAVWLDDRMLSWNEDFSEGYAYDEQRDVWHPITAIPAPLSTGTIVIATDDAIILWDGARSFPNVGFRLTL
jgi:hypothetical protein